MAAYIAELGATEAPWRWELAFDFSQPMVDAIKAQIPSRERKYIPERKVWWFKPGMLAAVQVLAERHCGSVQYVTHDGAGLEVAIPSEMAAAYRTLHLLPSAPPELVKAAYRVACKLHHPDAGGTTREMQRVNEAYGLLAARRHR